MHMISGYSFSGFQIYTISVIVFLCRYYESMHTRIAKLHLPM